MATIYQAPLSTSPLDYPLLPQRPRVASHYRPFSTISTASSSDLNTKTRHRSSLRPYSSSGLPSLSAMGFHFKERSKDKDTLRSRKHSDMNPPRPGPPLRTASDAPDQGSSTSQGHLKIHKLTKRRSLASLLAPDATTAASNVVSSPESYRSSPLNPSAPTYPRTRLTHKPRIRLERIFQEEGEYNTTDKFVAKNTWTKRHNMTLHPYSLDAPYIQAYDPILLENDRHTDILLRRLNPTGSPSFHDYGKKPPATILDLGCGQGHWILDAANAWKNSQITGFDLVDVTLEAIGRMDNIKFVRGNFIKYRLPFADRSFDLVRMANLSLCIPYNKWHFVIAEAQRVLTSGGRLELIDDQIFFPYGEAPKVIRPSSPITARRVSASLQGIDGFDVDQEDDDDSTLEGDDDAMYFDTTSTLVGDRSSTSTDEKMKAELLSMIDDSARLLADLPSNLSTPTADTATASFASLAPPMSWNESAAASKDCEKVFEDMLSKKYGIHWRPSEFIVDVMKMVFGNGNARKMTTMHLKLAPIDAYTGSCAANSSTDKVSDKEAGLMPSDSNVPSSFGKKPWITIEWDKKEKKDKKHSLDSSKRTSGERLVSSDYVPGDISAKAAGRLGIPHLGTTSSPGPRTSLESSTVATQSPGLILWPSTFIPLSPSELEMHACKHMHTLLGCKSALSDFVETFKDENGARLLCDAEFCDSMWQYECFRRQRFGWPAEVPESHMDLDSPSRPRSASTPKPVSRSSAELNLDSQSSPSRHNLDSNSMTGPYGVNELPHVRTLRVYEAVKSADHPSTSLLLPRYSPAFT